MDEPPPNPKVPCRAAMMGGSRVPRIAVLGPRRDRPACARGASGYDGSARNPGREHGRRGGTVADGPPANLHAVEHVGELLADADGLLLEVAPVGPRLHRVAVEEDREHRGHAEVAEVVDEGARPGEV